MGDYSGRRETGPGEAPPPVVAKSAHPHPGWVRMGVRPCQLGEVGRTTTGRMVLPLDKEGSPELAPDLVGARYV